MDANQYQEKAWRTSASRPSEFEYCALVSGLGLAGEAGEVADALKKAIGHQHGLDVQSLKLELGDVLWYVADLASLLGLSLSDIMEANIEKLQARYPDGFSVERSKNREE